MNAITLPNLPALQAALAALPRILQDALATVGPQALLSLIPDLAHYPSPPAGSTYHRSGTLGRLWTGAQPVWRADGTMGFTATLGNATPYGPYVQDPTSQAPWMDHWDTTQDVLDAHTTDIAAILARALAEGLAEVHA